MKNRLLLVFVCALTHHSFAETTAPAGGMTPLPPLDNSGPVKLVSASWLGGAGEDAFVAAAIDAAGNILLAGNGGEIGRPGPETVSLGGGAIPSEGGFVFAITPDGRRVLRLARFPANVTLSKLDLDGRGNIYVLGEAKGEVKLGAATGSGTFVAVLPPNAGKVERCQFIDRATDLAVDENGDFVVLENRKLSRYVLGTEAALWTVNWPTHGDNRPGGIGLSRKTGIVAVVGYGMTHTGHEPWKDPYGYGFDRAGKQVWALWNPDPKDQADAQKYGGTGLMADTTGSFVGTTGTGDFLLGLYADGGNTVLMRDPQNPREKLDPSVFAGVFQDGPGFGFKGASSTSAVLRANPAGKLLKGTFMCAWLTPQRANGLGMSDATGNERGDLFVAGGSAYGCPVKSPWFEVPEGGYKGGGFLAVFDPDFKMKQCGYFPGTSVTCVATGRGVAVIAGNALESAKGSDRTKPNAPEITYPTALHQPVQPQFGGGKKDAWFAIFKTP